MNVLAIIPARAGSKSIPHKNIREIAGKPLLAWTVAAALESQKVTRVVVSTDGADIARVAREAGAEVIERPAELATDTASSESALLHVLNTLATRENYHPDLIVFLQCTSPLTTGSEIDQTINQLLANNADSAFSAVPFYYFIWKNTPEGAIGINHLASIRQRRQERPPQFLESGAIYVMRATGFLCHNHRFFGKILAVEFPISHLQEIDDPADWQIAEARLLERLKRQGKFKLPVRPEAVIFDFDGVFTDNLVSIDSSGNETVRCSRADGFGIRLLQEAGFSLAVISTEINPVVSHRCEKLGLECLQGIHDKKAALLEFAAARQFSLERLIFVGNDLNDLPAFEVAGCRAAPADAHPEILRQADIILTRNGGHGAIRELAELLLSNI